MERRVAMPRASWRGFLRLSLVSCPVYLSPATTRAKPIRLHQVWQPALVDGDEDELSDRSAGLQDSASSSARMPAESGGLDADPSPAATRIALRPHDPGTGEEIDKREVVRGYEYSRGQFVTFTPEELKALDVESSKVIDLEKFVSWGDLDPIYLDSSYYLYADGPIAVETLRVIGAAMAEAGVVGLGRLTLSRRERVVMVEPRGTGMGLFTLRAADEVRAAQFASAEGEIDAEMVAIAKAILAQRTGTFDPSTYRDRYQEALRELIEAKMKGLTEGLGFIRIGAPGIGRAQAATRAAAAQKGMGRRLNGMAGRTGQNQIRPYPSYSRRGIVMDGWHGVGRPSDGRRVILLLSPS